MRKKLIKPEHSWQHYQQQCEDPQQLAAMMFGWRSELGITAETAAVKLGLPVRTLNGIEQGRGFRYPLLLTAAMKQVSEG